MSPALEMKGITFGYDRSEPVLLDSIDLAVEKGSVTAVLGPNGAGKTTLLHLMLGLLTPDSGGISVLGTPMAQMAPQQVKKKLGLVAPVRSLPFDMQVHDYVLLGRAPHKGLLEIPGKGDHDKAGAALAAVGMAAFAQKGVTTLSSGELQLVSLARALAQDPKILLLDEPTSHLDLINTRRILELMGVIAGQGTTVVFTTHDPNAAAAVAHAMVLMGKGELVATGAADTVFTGELLTRTYGEHVEMVHTDRGPMVRLI